MDQRTSRKEGYIREAAATFVQEFSNKTSLITVTRVELRGDGKQAKIYVTVLPAEKEAEAVEFLKRKRSEMYAYLKDKARIMQTPLVDFLPDIGEKNRMRLDELSS